MQNSIKRVSIVFAALLPILVLGFFVMKGESPEEEAAEAAAAIAAAKSENSGTVVNTPATAPVPTPAPATGTGAASSATFADGTYTAVGAYTSPAGAESINVSVTLVNDIVTAMTVTANATNETSKLYQNVFIADGKVLVVGKNIADVQLGKVSGSSLTPKGFNDALNAIKTQAEV